MQLPVKMGRKNNGRMFEINIFWPISDLLMTSLAILWSYFCASRVSEYTIGKHTTLNEDVKFGVHKETIQSEDEDNLNVVGV